MIARILLALIGAGALAGVWAHLLQLVEVRPLILMAETYEAAGAEQAATHAHGNHGLGDHGLSDWLPAELGRGGMTLLANILSGIAFALLVGAAITLRGRQVDWKRGALWGLGGFAATALAPALGLPPELPGTQSADLAARQVWWVGTALATAGGIGLILLTGRRALQAAGVALIAVPHMIGAPEVETLASGALPAELAAEFAIASLVAALAFWVVLGALTGLFLGRWALPAAAAGEPRLSTHQAAR